jgi:putative Mg2+ transporter-C (MgtC) family protein
MPSVLGLWGDSLDHLVHLLVAFVLALPIGWHRAREEQSAGLRTFPLVAIASCGLVQTAISVFGANATVNANIQCYRERKYHAGRGHRHRFHRCGRNHQTR